MNKLEKHISNLIDQLGIERGSKIILSVNLLELFKVYKFHRELFSDSAALIFNEFKKKIGCDGTFITPVFNYQFCKGTDFYRGTTSGQSGSFGNLLLKNTNLNLKRTRHPIYSFLVNGADENLFLNLDDVRAFGSKSPFSKFVEHGYKFITIGHHFIRSNTLVHFAESQAGASYRYEKNFTAAYYDYDLVETVKTYSMYVRNLDLCDVSGITSNGLKSLFLNGAVTRVVDKNFITSYVVDQAKAYEIMHEDLISRRHYVVQCYKHPTQLSDVIFGRKLDDIELSDKQFK